MRTKKRVITSIAATSLLIGTVASAQLGGTTDTSTAADVTAVRSSGFGGAFRGLPGGGRGDRGLLPFGRGLALGTTVQVSLYDAQPGEGVEPAQTLDFTVGEDSEVAFMQELTAAQEGAAFMVIATGEQTRTIDLPDATDVADAAGTLGSRRAPRLGVEGFGLPLNGLEQGDTVTATFYDGDPEEGGEELQELSFTYGESSAIGFQNDLTEAAEEADFVTVTLPPQERVVDLSATSTRLDAGRGFGPESGFGRGSDRGFGRGFGRGSGRR